MGILYCLLIPFIGTALGSSMVFLMKNKINKKLEKILLGFASGVMIAASIWSLLIPSIDMAKEQNVVEWIPATIGFLSGIVFLLILDSVIPHLHLNSDKPEGIKSKIEKSVMRVFAITLHNIPEGMALGIILAGALAQNTGITIASALALGIGIAIQNFPEGAIVSLSMNSSGVSKKKAFGLGVLSGAVEPLGALLTMLLVNLISPALPYLLSFAAGAMLFVVVEELVPDMSKGKHSHIGTIMFGLGFIMMLILEVVMG
jgi:ZIP family zinc transporter